MALKFSVKLWREGMRKIGLATVAVCLFAMVIDQQSTVRALLGMALGFAILLLGLITDKDEDEGGKEE